MARQFLPEARRYEQHVVGAGAEEDHRHDAGRLPRDRDPVAEGVPGRYGPGHLEDQSHPQQRDGGHDRGAVDDHQKHQHQQDGHHQEQRVDLREHPDQVDDEASGPAHGNLYTAQIERRRAVPDGLHRVEEGRIGRLAGHLREHVHSGAVGGHEAGPLTHDRVGAENLAHVVRRGRAGQPGGQLGRRPVRGIPQTLRLPEHDQDRGAGRRETLLCEPVRPGGLGVPGQEERLLVLVGVREHRELRDQCAGGDQPDDERHPLATATGSEIGETAEHYRLPRGTPAGRRPRLVVPALIIERC